MNVSKGETGMKPTRDGQRAIERWENAVKAVERADRELRSAECELANASTELAKWLKPEDAKPGEVFSAVAKMVESVLISRKKYGTPARIRTRLVSDGAA